MINNYQTASRSAVECSRRHHRTWHCTAKVFASPFVDEEGRSWLRVDEEKTRWRHNHPLLAKMGSAAADELGLQEDVEDVDDEVEIVSLVRGKGAFFSSFPPYAPY
jgi:hypothetical protein